MFARKERPLGALTLLLLLAAPALAGETVLRWSDVLEHVEDHPALAAARAELRAADGAIRSVALPNPEVELGAGRAEALEGDETADTWELGVGIPLRPWGPWRHERRAARARRAGAAGDLAALRLQVEAELAGRFWRVAHGQRRAEILGRRLEQVERLVEVARLRTELGETRSTDPLRAEIEHERLLGEIRRAEFAASAERRGLALWIDMDPAPDYRVSADWDRVPSLPELDTLMERQGEHPALAASDSRHAGAMASLHAAKADRLPGLELGAFVEHEMDAEVRGFSVSFELPLFNFRGGAVATADAELARARHRRDAHRRSLAESLAAAHAEAAGARTTLIGYRDVILPKAERNVSALEHLYTVGEESLLELLAARHELAEAETELLDAHLTYRLALAELATLAGGSDHD